MLLFFSFQYSLSRYHEKFPFSSDKKGSIRDVPFFFHQNNITVFSFLSNNIVCRINWRQTFTNTYFFPRIHGPNKKELSGYLAKAISKTRYFFLLKQLTTSLLRICHIQYLYNNIYYSCWSGELSFIYIYLNWMYFWEISLYSLYKKIRTNQNWA